MPLAAVEADGRIEGKDIHDEEQSKQELSQRWNQFTKEDKVICIGEASIDDTPSYVELETCREMVVDQSTP